MAKCPVCGNKLRFMRTTELKDGKICNNCLKSVGARNFTPKDSFILLHIKVDDIRKHKENHTQLDLKQAAKDIKERKRENRGDNKKPQITVNNPNNPLDKLINKTDNPERMKQIVHDMHSAGFNDNFGTNKELKTLPDVLDKDEKFLYGASGFVDGQTVLIVLTQKRVVMINKGMIYGNHTSGIPLDMVNGVTFDTGMLLGSISITNGSKTTKLDQLQKRDCPILADKIKNAASEFKNNMYNNNQNQKPQQQSNDIASELVKLSKLNQAGVLSDEEFKAAKKKTLGL